MTKQIIIQNNMKMKKKDLLNIIKNNMKDIVLTEENIKQYKKDLLDDVEDAIKDIINFKKRVQKIKFPTTLDSFDDLSFFDGVVNAILDELTGIKEYIDSIEEDLKNANETKGD